MEALIMSFNKELLEILTCPRCKGQLTLAPEEVGLVCPACKLEYPIRDDVPVMMVDEAKPVK